MSLPAPEPPPRPPAGAPTGRRRRAPAPGSLDPGGRAAEHLGAGLAASVLLYLLAGVGMAYVAGFSAIDQRLDNIHLG